MKREILNYGRLEQLLGKPFDPVRAFFQMVPCMVEQGRELGVADAHSYRGFHVAGSLYAINEAEKTAWYDTGGNLKRSGKDKVCVERKLLGRGVKSMTRAIGMVVMGTTNPEEIREVSDFATPTLHFCSRCRHYVSEHPLVTPSMLVVTCGLDSDVNQTSSVGEIKDMYARAERGDVDATLFKAQPDFTDWEMRLATYDFAVTQLAKTQELSLETRQNIAQLAMSKSLTV